MKRNPARYMLPLMMILTVFLILAACDKNNAPTGPDGGGTGTAALMGVVLGNSGISSAPDSFRITGDGIDTTVVVDADLDYRYMLSDIPPGTYTVAPVAAGGATTVILPENWTVTVTSGTAYVNPFIRLSTSELAALQANSQGIVAGYIDCGRDVYPNDFRIYLADREEQEIHEIAVASDGYFRFSARSYDFYRVFPRADNYEFDPQSRLVAVNGNVVIANFTATYTGAEPHVITCRVTSTAQEYQPYLTLQAHLYNGSTLEVAADADGRITTPPLAPGAYTVTVNCRDSLSLPNSRYYDEQSFSYVAVADSDVDLGDLMFLYDGPMHYRISGTVTDAAGNPIPGVTLILSDFPVQQAGQGTTNPDDDGKYFYGGVYFYTVADLNMTLTAHKNGWTFTPPAAALVHPYQSGRQLVEFTADFTGAQILMAPYFPLASGATWTYRHTADGVLSGTVTAEAGTSFAAGGNTWIPLSGYMYIGLEGYRVDGAAVYAWTGQEAETWADLSKTSWNIGAIGGTAAAGVLLAPEDVTVPAGTFEQCRVIRTTVPPNNPSAVVTTYWLAEGVGPIKVEYTATSAGTVIQHVTDELVSHQAP